MGVKNRKRLNPVVMVAHRPESDKWPDEPDRNNTDWRYTVEYRDPKTKELVVHTRVDEMHARTVFMENGYASKGLQSVVSAAKMRARDPEGKRGNTKTTNRSGRTTLESRAMVANRVTLWKWCVLHERPHLLTNRNAEWDACKQHHRVITVIARRDEGPF